MDHTFSDEERLIKWGLPHEPFTEHGISYRFRLFPDRRSEFDYTKVYQIVKPSKRSKINRGDRVIVDHVRASRFINRCEAMVREKYRITKYKPFGTFSDYYVIIELLDGRLAGETRTVTPSFVVKI